MLTLYSTYNKMLWPKCKQAKYARLIFTIEIKYKIIFECDKFYNKEVIELKSIVVRNNLS